MLKKIPVFILLIFLFAGMCVLNNSATQKVFASQPPWYFLTPHSYNKFTHILGVGFGYRSLLADFEYISFLQYYGNWDNRLTHYNKLYSYIDNITDADPHFTFAYTFGSAILAFNLSRYDEAVEVIDKGLKYNPQFWQLHYYLGAIGFRKEGNKDKYVKFLEEALKFENHPAIIERLLGNIYEQYKPADEAALYWAGTYMKTKDKQTRDHAHSRIMYMIENRMLKDPDSVVKQIE
jgi:tetratricopeptide (TPR) repeat protein